MRGQTEAPRKFLQWPSGMRRVVGKVTIKEPVKVLEPTKGTDAKAGHLRKLGVK